MLEGEFKDCGILRGQFGPRAGMERVVIYEGK